MTVYLTALEATAALTTNLAPQMGMINRYNAAGGALALTLPALSGLNVGANCVVAKDILDTSGNAITVTRTGTDTFDDGTTGFTLLSAGSQRVLQVVEIDAVKYWKITDYGSPETDISGLQPKSTLTTKGDLYVATASGVVTRRAVGTDGQVLTADSAHATGISWTTLAATRSTESAASSATPTPAIASPNHFAAWTALAANATFGAPTGTVADGYKLMVRVKDNGTARTLAYNAIYRAIGTTLPTTTVINKTLYLGMIYNNADTKWDVVAVGQEA